MVIAEVDSLEPKLWKFLIWSTYGYTWSNLVHYQSYQFLFRSCVESEHWHFLGRTYRGGSGIGFEGTKKQDRRSGVAGRQVLHFGCAGTSGELDGPDPPIYLEG